jgi:exodeoxyribonuclease VII small subunit
MSEKKNSISFEKSMEELEQIANELENEELSLDESVEKFKKGMEISKTCKEALDDAEKQINILINGEEKDFVAND